MTRRLILAAFAAALATAVGAAVWVFNTVDKMTGRPR